KGASDRNQHSFPPTTGKKRRCDQTYHRASFCVAATRPMFAFINVSQLRNEIGMMNPNDKSRDFRTRIVRSLGKQQPAFTEDILNRKKCRLQAVDPYDAYGAGEARLFDDDVQLHSVDNLEQRPTNCRSDLKCESSVRIQHDCPTVRCVAVFCV